MISIVRSTNRRAVSDLLSAARIRDRATERRVEQIVEGVRRGGDATLRRYARELDGLEGAIEVPRREWEKAADALPSKVRRSIVRAARNIRSVAKRQVPKGW